MELLQFVENSNNFCNFASLGPQCIVCNCGSLSTYVDLGLITSVTSQTETPLKEKIKHILSNKWISLISEAAFSLCIQCFHLVDQYDSLEAQLKIIHNEICNKYVNGHGIIHTIQTFEKPEPQHFTANTNGERTKRTASSKRASGSKRKKASLDSNIPTLHAQIVQIEPEPKRDLAAEASALLQWHTTPVAVYEAAAAAAAVAAAAEVVAGTAGPEPVPPPPPPLLVTGLPTVTWTGDPGLGMGAGADDVVVDVDVACPSLRILTLDNPPPLPSLEDEAAAQLAAEQAVDDPGLLADAFAEPPPPPPPIPPPMPPAPPPPPPKEMPPLAVYDDSIQGLLPGERVRIGTARGESDAGDGDEGAVGEGVFGTGAVGVGDEGAVGEGVLGAGAVGDESAVGEGVFGTGDEGAVGEGVLGAGVVGVGDEGAVGESVLGAGVVGVGDEGAVGEGVLGAGGVGDGQGAGGVGDGQGAGGVGVGDGQGAGVVGAGGTTESAYTCFYCTCGFADVASLRQHWRAVHRPVVLTATLPEQLGLGPRANCGVELSGVQPPPSDPATAHARPYVCLFCDGAFKFKSNLQLHYKHKHTPHKPFACADCHAAFRRSIELSRHRVYYCPLRRR